MGKHSILWLIALLVGIFFITEELEESVVMVKKGMELGMESNWMFLFQYAVIVLFVRVALHFTISRIPKKNFHVKQGLAVGTLFLLFSIFVSICVNPVIQKVNQIILEKNRNLHIDPDFPYYKQLYFYSLNNS